ncbi:MAG: hypothetical protein NC548_25750 [Lachnospiraceae bacterium]|nr:hypothetical protein [Lachnospiraceae bacterium]
MNFKEIKNKLPSREEDFKTIKITEDLSFKVRRYLPIDKKIELIGFVVDNALDAETGTFSPVRVNVAFDVGLMMYYANFSFDADDNLAEIYDLLEGNRVVDSVMAAIPEEELKFMKKLVDETVTDIARFNTSAAGIIHSMSENAGNLDENLTDILSKIRDKKGLEVLDEIKNVVGND